MSNKHSQIINLPLTFDVTLLTHITRGPHCHRSGVISHATPTGIKETGLGIEFSQPAGITTNRKNGPLRID